MEISSFAVIHVPSVLVFLFRSFIYLFDRDSVKYQNSAASTTILPESSLWGSHFYINAYAIHHSATSVFHSTVCFFGSIHVKIYIDLGQTSKLFYSPSPYKCPLFYLSIPLLLDIQHLL